MADRAPGETPVLLRDPAATLVAFARTLRAAGVRATAHQVQSAVEAVGSLDLMDRDQVYWGTRLTMCAEPDDLPRFDAAFAAFFGLETALASTRRTPVPRQQLVTLPSDGGGGPEERDQDAAKASTASDTEVLRHRDVSTLNADERNEIRRMFALLDPVGPTRPGRRHRPHRRGAIDPSRTVRDTLRHGGHTVRLLRERPVPRSRRLVLLVDVSGSMQPYAEAMLRFAHAAARRRPGTEVFTLGTRLTRITPYLRCRDGDDAMTGMANAVPDWSGGTRLGEQLRAFLARWGRRGCARGAVVVVFSDGWERGGPELLGEQVADLRRLAHRIVWVNPHRGVAGFAPLTGGMQAVLPYLDALVAGHTFAAFEALAKELGRNRPRTEGPPRA